MLESVECASLEVSRLRLQKREGWTNDWVTSMEPSILSPCDLEPLYSLLYLILKRTHEVGDVTVPILQTSILRPRKVIQAGSGKLRFLYSEAGTLQSRLRPGQPSC